MSSSKRRPATIEGGRSIRAPSEKVLEAVTSSNEGEEMLEIRHRDRPWAIGLALGIIALAIVALLIAAVEQFRLHVDPSHDSRLQQSPTYSTRSEPPAPVSADRLRKFQSAIHIDPTSRPPPSPLTRRYTASRTKSGPTTYRIELARRGSGRTTSSRGESGSDGRRRPMRPATPASASNASDLTLERR